MTRITFPLAATAGALALGLAMACAAHSCVAQTVQLHEGYSHDPSKRVTYAKIDSSDVDLRTAAGARTMLRRIEVAAGAVCGGESNALTLAQKRDYRDCRDDAIRSAVSMMGRKPLTQLARLRQRELLAER